jgi:hypothetical protein
MTDVQKNGRFRLSIDTIITIAIIVIGFIANMAVRSYEVGTMMKRMDRVEAAMCLKLDKSVFDAHDTTRTHYMVGSPVMDKLDGIERELIEVKTLVRERMRKP